MQGEAGDAGRFRRQLQAPARRDGQCVDFTDHRGDHAAAQPLFHCPEQVALIGGADEQQTLCRKACPGQAGRVKIRLAQAPQDRPPRRASRQNAGKKRCRGAVFAHSAGVFDLVQRRQGQAAPGQGAIDRGRPERQHLTRRLAEAFRRGKVSAQIDQPRVAGIFRSLTHNVLYLFFSAD